MRKKFNWGNFIKLIVLVGCISLVSFDYLTIILNMFKGITTSFTWFGIFIDLNLLFISQIIYNNLFERN